MPGMLIAIAALVIVLLVVVAIHDLTQRQHAILRTFPVVGHFRYWLEAVGPELRQYIVTDNNEERPFSRDQRRWSRLKGRSSLLSVTMYCRSSGPTDSSQ